MKFLGTFALFSFQSYQILAQQEQGSSDIEDISGRKLNQIWNMLYHIEPSFNSEPDSRQFILKHGCYCHASGASPVGSRNGYHGAPLDELDALCRDLWRSQKCLNHEESDADDEKCPTTVAYAFEKNGDKDNNDASIACGRASSDRWMNKDEHQCDIKLCELEKEFAYKVKELIASGFQRDPSISKIADAEYEQFCPNNGFAEQRENFACCGEGIGRKPFDPVTKQCCADRITEVGSC